ncbi:hypothetical protein M5D96_009481 [Drosophila gunungcola]|uniref:Uncharacterized protein n=1 Tax=Drosophila gunungcola TaxID=103775 RepID=A0A9P9YIP7_9MUSC|nr:hypothetical protein M5D96_009481 [Drosophila gunungcola]
MHLGPSSSRAANGALLQLPSYYPLLARLQIKGGVPRVWGPASHAIAPRTRYRRGQEGWTKTEGRKRNRPSTPSTSQQSSRSQESVEHLHAVRPTSCKTQSLAVPRRPSPPRTMQQLLEAKLKSMLA